MNENFEKLPGLISWSQAEHCRHYYLVFKTEKDAKLICSVNKQNYIHGHAFLDLDDNGDLVYCISIPPNKIDTFIKAYIDAYNK